MPGLGRADQLLDSLRGFVDAKSGFGNERRKVKYVESIFADFDRDGSGFIDEEEFIAGLVRMNVVGCTQTVQDLFDRFDEDFSGRISYEEFAAALFSSDGERTNARDKQSRETDDVVARVKARILQIAGKNAGIRACTRVLRHMDRDGSNTLDMYEFEEGLYSYGVTVSPADMDKLMLHFDKDKSGRITIEEFLRGIRGEMNRERKKMVRMGWEQLVSHLKLDGPSDSVKLSDLASFYDVSKNPRVLDGSLTEEQALRDFMTNWDKNGDDVIEWREFLDYYRDLSAGIEDDDYWELMIRNAWHITGGEGWCENTSNIRCLVTFFDGSQKVVELTDDFGVSRSSVTKPQLISMLRRQNIRNVEDVSLQM